MVVIRLSRSGTTKRPFYHIVVCDSRARRDGGFIERLGFSNPMAAEHEEPRRIDRQRYEHWCKVGARPSPAVRKIYRMILRAASAVKEVAKKAADSAEKVAQQGGAKEGKISIKTA